MSLKNWPDLDIQKQNIMDIQLYHEYKGLFNKPEYLKSLKLTQQQEKELWDFIVDKFWDRYMDEWEWQAIFDKIESLKKWVKQETKTHLKNIKKEIVKSQKKEAPKTQIQNIDVSTLENLKPAERMKQLEVFLDSGMFDSYLSAVISKLEGKVIPLEWKKTTFDRDYIMEHNHELKENLKKLVLMIIHMETDGNIFAVNPTTWASWLGQWLTWNGKYKKEYMYNGRYRQNKIAGRKPSKIINRRRTNSLETRLKNIKNSYNNDTIAALDFIPNTFSKPSHLHPSDLSIDEQIKLIILDLGSHNKKVRGKGIQDYLGTALLGSSWASKKIYEIFHHTAPDKSTKIRISKITPQYTGDLIALYKKNT